MVKSQIKKESPPQNEHTEFNSLMNALNSAFNKQSFILMFLLILLVLYTLYFASSIILPIVIALLLHYLLSPLMRFLKKIYIPSQIGAILLLLIFFASIGYGFYNISGPANEWLKKSPTVISEVSNKISNSVSFLQKPLATLNNLQKQINNATQPATENNPPVVEVKEAHYDFIGFIFNKTSDFFLELSITIFLLYFLLAYEDFLLIKIIKVLPTLKDKKDAVTITRMTEHKIGVYLLARVAINVGLAIVISILMYFLEMPNPVLWGVAAGLLEFIPYLGILLGTIIVGMVAVVSFDNIWHILLVPTLFFLVSSIEGSYITPVVLGRSLTINPIAVFLAVIFWGWMWGITGALIAIPMIIVMKIIYENLFISSMMGELLDE